MAYGTHELQLTGFFIYVLLQAVKPAIRGQTYMLDRMNDEDEEMEAQVKAHLCAYA